MTDVCTADGCDYPRTEQGWLCRNCERALAGWLADVPALLGELDTTLARLDAIGAGVGARGAEQPLPYKPSAGDARLALETAVATWARVLAEERGITLTVANTAAAADWLRAHVTSVGMSAWAADAVAELARVHADAYRAIDRPPDLLLAGPCRVNGCPAWLYARPGARYCQCRECGATHDVAERREWMMTAAGNMRVPATLAQSWVRLLTGWTIPSGTWRAWRSRGQLVPVIRDGQGRERYRFADVHELAAGWLRHKTAA